MAARIRPLTKAVISLNRSSDSHYILGKSRVYATLHTVHGMKETHPCTRLKMANTIVPAVLLCVSSWAATFWIFNLLSFARPNWILRCSSSLSMAVLGLELLVTSSRAVITTMIVNRTMERIRICELKQQKQQKRRWCWQKGFVFTSSMCPFATLSVCLCFLRQTGIATRFPPPPLYCSMQPFVRSWGRGRQYWQSAPVAECAHWSFHSVLAACPPAPPPEN